jgi:hypothetical protein
VTSFAGAGAHHHNGTAERAIQTIMNMSRTMMLHAAIHWPDVADSTLWPMAVAHAVYLYNHMPALDTGHVYQNVMGTAEVSQRSCLGMSGICVG